MARTTADSRTKADWKALRETIGISTGSLASFLDKNISTVQYWENPGRSASRYHPTKKAWQMLEQLRQKQKSVVDQLVEAAVRRAKDGEAPAGQDGRPLTVLYYYRNRAEYYRSDKGDIGILNATARQAALRLEAMGFEVRFRYDEADMGADTDTDEGRDSSAR